MQELLIDRFVRRDEACRAKDWPGVRELEVEIDDASARQKELRGS